MARRLPLMLLCTTVLLFIACSDDDDGPTSSTRIHGSGNLITQGVTVDVFHSVVMNAVGTITLTHGGLSACSLTVDDNIMQYIEITVDDGRLMIDVQQGVSLHDYDLTVNLAMSDLETVTVNGVASIIAQNEFTVDEVSIVVNGVGFIDMDMIVARLNTTCTGVGTIHVRGAADRHDCTFSAAITMAAFELVTDTTVIELSGEGVAEITANDLLDVTITGSGLVYYRGQPTINVTVTGTGRLIDAN